MLTNHYKIYHGIKLADNSKIYNVEIEELEKDPNPVRVGRIWYNKSEKLYKHTTYNAANEVIIKSFTDITFINTVTPSPTDFFTIPDGTGTNEAISLLVAEVNKLYSKLNNLVLAEEFYTLDGLVDSLDLVTIPSFVPAISKYKFVIYINGLEQSKDCFEIISNKIKFKQSLPAKALIKVMYYNY